MVGERGRESVCQKEGGRLGKKEGWQGGNTFVTIITIIVIIRMLMTFMSSI